MATVAATATPSAAELYAFVCGLSDAEQERIGDLETPESRQLALDAFQAGVTGKETDDKSETRTRVAQVYSVLVIVRDSSGGSNHSAMLIGSAAGRVGRESSDPAEKSALGQLTDTAEMRVVKLEKAGKQACVIRVKSEDAASWLR